AAAVYEVLKKHMQALNIMVPAMVIQAISVCISAVAGVVLVFYTPAGFIGAPIAVCIAQWSMLLLTVLYFRRHRAINTAVRRTALARWYARVTASSDHAPVDVAAGGDGGAPQSGVITHIDDLLDATMPTVSLEEVRKGWKEFLSLGLPSAAMLMGEWCAFEAAAIVAGLVSTTTLAAHSIMATTSGLCYMPMLGLSAASGIRIGQRMGEQSAQGARLTYHVGLVLTLACVLVTISFLLVVQAFWGRLFTTDADVIDLIRRWLFVLAIFVVFDAYMCVGCGFMRGVGRPALAAVATVISYLIIGLGTSYLFAVASGFGLPGIWMGFTVGAIFAAIMLIGMLQWLDWDKEAHKAHVRAKGTAPAADATSRVCVDGNDSASAPSVCVGAVIPVPAASVDDFRVSFAAEVSALTRHADAPTKDRTSTRS
ncbi:hypothetical protein EON62_04080, partial [archaeon]